MSTRSDWKDTMALERKLNVQHGHVDATGVLRIPIEPAPDDSWLASFRDAGMRLQHETRGQQYDRLVIEGDELVASGVNSATIRLTRDFFSMWVASANRLDKQRETEAQRAAKRHDETVERAADDARRATELLRQP
jgi:hypothetical protein